MKDENIYRRLDNGRYQAYGVCYQPEHLPDGIWYVRHHDRGSRAVKSVPYIAGLFRVGEEKEIDIPTLCGMEDMVDKIEESKEWQDMLNQKDGVSLNDIAHICVKVIMDLGKEQKKNDK